MAGTPRGGIAGTLLWLLLVEQNVPLSLEIPGTACVLDYGGWSITAPPPRSRSTRP